MCIISQRKSLSKFKRSVFERSWWIYLLFDQAKHILGCHKAIPGRALAPPQPTNANIENMSLRCSCITRPNPWRSLSRSKPNVDSFEIQCWYVLALQINFWYFKAFPTGSVVQGQKKPYYICTITSLGGPSDRFSDLRACLTSSFAPFVHSGRATNATLH